jgi:hypothetical protein
MQNALDIIQTFCKIWKLEINIAKTKMMIFSKRKTLILHGKHIEVVDTYSYLGFIFKCNGKFLEAKRKLVNQAQKALYSLYKN